MQILCMKKTNITLNFIKRKLQEEEYPKIKTINNEKYVHSLSKLKYSNCT